MNVKNAVDELASKNDFPQLDEQLRMELTIKRDEFFALLQTGNTWIRIKGEEVFVPNRADWTDIKVVDRTYISKPLLPWLHFYIDILEEYGMKINQQNLTPSQLIAMVINMFFVATAAKKERTSKELRKAAQKEEIEVLEHKLDDNMHFLRRNNEKYFFEDLLPELDLPLHFYNDGEKVEIIARNKDAKERSDKQQRLLVMKKFVGYLCGKFKKNMAQLSQGQNIESMEKLSVELAIVYIKLCLKKPITVSKHAIYSSPVYTSLLLGLSQAGSVQIQEKKAPIPTPITEKKEKPIRRAVKISPSTQLHATFDATLLSQLWYKNAGGILHRLQKTFNLEQWMDVREVAVKLIQLADNEFAYIKKQHSFEFHIMAKLFENVLAEIDAHNTNKRWFMHVG